MKSPTVEDVLAYCQRTGSAMTVTDAGVFMANDLGAAPVRVEPFEIEYMARGPKPADPKRTAPLDAVHFLDAAAGHMGARASTYDSPQGERSMARTVAVFNAHHGTNLTEAQGWHFMQVLKDVRLFQRGAFHQDSAEDGVAYASLKAEAKAREARDMEGDPEKLEAARQATRVPPANDNTPRCCSGQGKQSAAKCSGCHESHQFGRV